MKRNIFIVLAVLLIATPVIADQVVFDDHIVLGSQCVGLDCVNGENFGFDTIVLKENNLRIRFQDTSNSAQFPTTDWMLVANDSSNGGRSRFSIEDATEQTEPFTVMSGAPTASLHVMASGFVGMGTPSPAQNLHVAAGDTPTVRLEQTPAVGWPQYAWDIATNESNLFIRDVNTGALPVRVLAGASDDGLVVTGTGLHVSSPGVVQMSYEDTAQNVTWVESFTSNSWTVGDGSTDAISVTANGDMTIGGTLSQGSSRTFKHRITKVDDSEVLERARGLEINRWRYKNDADQSEHMGPMAEDFREAFGLGADEKHLASSDVAGVALASMQALSRVVDEQAAQLERLAKQNARLEKRLARLEARLAK